MARPNVVHVRDDENKQYVDLDYPITLCGNFVAPKADRVSYSVPPEKVITSRTAVKRMKKSSDGICKRCARSV